MVIRRIMAKGVKWQEEENEVHGYGVLRIAY